MEKLFAPIVYKTTVLSPEAYSLSTNQHNVGCRLYIICPHLMPGYNINNKQQLKCTNLAQRQLKSGSSVHPTLLPSGLEVSTLN